MLILKRNNRTILTATGLRAVWLLINTWKRLHDLDGSYELWLA
jgi:hypothetical protein